MLLSADRQNFGMQDAAIREAEGQLSEMKVRSARLKAAIKLFREHKNVSTHN